MDNNEIKQLLKDEHIFMWQIAQILKIHESTFIRWFRTPITEAKEQQIMSAIKVIKDNRSKS